MARIKILDLPEDTKLLPEELKRVFGGGIKGESTDSILLRNFHIEFRSQLADPRPTPFWDPGE
jgi:hypothetical protein